MVTRETPRRGPWTSTIFAALAEIFGTDQVRQVHQLDSADGRGGRADFSALGEFQRPRSGRRVRGDRWWRAASVQGGQTTVSGRGVPDRETDNVEGAGASSPVTSGMTPSPPACSVSRPSWSGCSPQWPSSAGMDAGRRTATISLGFWRLLLCILVVALLEAAPSATYAGSMLQVLAIASGLMVRMMFLLGSILAALSITAIFVARRVEGVTSRLHSGRHRRPSPFSRLSSSSRPTGPGARPPSTLMFDVVLGCFVAVMLPAGDRRHSRYRVRRRRPPAPDTRGSR